MRAAVLLGAVATLGLASAVAATWKSDPGSTPNEVKPAERKGIKIAGIGYVEPAGEIRRLAFSVDGVIGTCLVKVGQEVTAGARLMELRNDKEKQAVELVKAELAMAVAERNRLLAGMDVHEIEAAKETVELDKAKLRYAQLEFERVTSLRKSNSTSAADADLAETNIKQAIAQVRADEARLRHLEQIVRQEDIALADAKILVCEQKVKLAQKALADTVLLAPCDGTVLEILKREGDASQVTGDSLAVVFADLSRLRVRAEVDERFVHQLKEGLAATLHGRPLGEKSYRGTVVRVNRLMGPKTVFSRAAKERLDLDVVQLLIDVPTDFRFPVGLRVDVVIGPKEYR